MKADVEWLTDKIGILRGGSEFDEYGDAFEFSCTLVRFGESSCEIKGLSGKLCGGARKAIAKALENEGIFDAQWERKKSGVTKFRGGHT